MQCNNTFQCGYPTSTQEDPEFGALPVASRCWADYSPEVDTSDSFACTPSDTCRVSDMDFGTTLNEFGSLVEDGNQVVCDACPMQPGGLVNQFGCDTFTKQCTCNRCVFFFSTKLLSVRKRPNVACFPMQAQDRTNLLHHEPAVYSGRRTGGHVCFGGGFFAGDQLWHHALQPLRVFGTHLPGDGKLVLCGRRRSHWRVFVYAAAHAVAELLACRHRHARSPRRVADVCSVVEFWSILAFCECHVRVECAGSYTVHLHQHGQRILLRSQQVCKSLIFP